MDRRISELQVECEQLNKEVDILNKRLHEAETRDAASTVEVTSLVNKLKKSEKAHDKTKAQFEAFKTSFSVFRLMWQKNQRLSKRNMTNYCQNVGKSSHSLMTKSVCSLQQMSNLKKRSKETHSESTIYMMMTKS